MLRTDNSSSVHTPLLLSSPVLGTLSDWAGDGGYCDGKIRKEWGNEISKVGMAYHHILLFWYTGVCVVHIYDKMTNSTAIGPSEQIVDAVKSTVGIELFNEDLLHTFGLLGFIETQSNLVGVAVFETCENHSFRLGRCLIPEKHMLKRADDIFVSYINTGASYSPLGITNPEDTIFCLVILSENPTLHQVVVSYDNIVDSYDVSNVPAIIVVPVPMKQSVDPVENGDSFVFSYEFFDKNGALIQ